MDFTNNVVLTDDELSIVVASLQLNIEGYRNHINRYGETSVDYATKQAIQEMTTLFERLRKEYF